ncbi:response regulator [Bradyrhizobium sp. STM 3561]|uniref:response regulator n=1 Tax=Bradyrhizobium sp. STM 3561 TaxID=578923 RepID=UPI0038907D3B
MASEGKIVILVVEDDQQLQGVLEDVLGESGFETAITASGEEAVTLLKGNAAAYRALVADIGLRGRMTGWEVATRARQIDPDLPVVYLTGSHANEFQDRAVPYSALLRKPVEPDHLVEAISQLVTRPDQASRLDG